MRGSIIQRGNSYRIAVSLGKDAESGKYKQYFETLPYGSTKSDAERRRRQLLVELDKGSFVKPGNLTVSEYLEAWLRDYCAPNLAARTTESYQYIVQKHLVPALGKVVLTELKPVHLQRLYAEKLSSGRRDGTGGLSNRSVRYLHVTLHKALASAVKTGLLARNVADAVEPPRLHRHEMRTMSEGDVHLFLEMARPTSYYALFYLLIFTGMRRSEALALRWSDVDLDLCQLSVTRTLHQLDNGKVVFGQPKTVKGRRLVSLSPSTALVLKEHREAQATLRQTLGMSIADDDLVFAHLDGKPLLPDSVSHAWMNLSRRCGLKVSLHGARHTHASLMLKQGVHPRVVQERLGHGSIQVTLDTYSHVAPGLQQAAAVRFDEALVNRHCGNAVEAPAQK